jgi:hypothetical protein
MFGISQDATDADAKLSTGFSGRLATGRLWSRRCFMFKEAGASGCFSFKTTGGTGDAPARMDARRKRVSASEGMGFQRRLSTVIAAKFFSRAKQSHLAINAPWSGRRGRPAGDILPAVPIGDGEWEKVRVSALSLFLRFRIVTASFRVMGTAETRNAALETAKPMRRVPAMLQIHCRFAILERSGYGLGDGRRCACGTLLSC